MKPIVWPNSAWSKCKKLIQYLVLALACCFTYMFCAYLGYFPTHQDVVAGRKMENAIAGHKQIVRIDEIIDAKWDRVCVVLPYEQPCLMKEGDERKAYCESTQHKFGLNKLAGSVWWLIFTNDTRNVFIVRMTKHAPANNWLKRIERAENDAFGIVPQNCVSRDNAVLLFIDKQHYSIFGEKR